MLIMVNNARFTTMVWCLYLCWGHDEGENFSQLKPVLGIIDLLLQWWSSFMHPQSYHLGMVYTRKIVILGFIDLP